MTEARLAAGVVLAVLLTSGSVLPAVREPGSPLPHPRAAPAFLSDASADDPLLTRVYASAARDDEFVEIGNPRLEPIDVSGWSLSDGEATATFPLDAVIPPGGRLLVTRNSTSYREDVLAPADFTFEIGDARRMEGGVPRLADMGDEILLMDREGLVRDAYVWGDASYAGLGWLGRPAEAMGRGEIAVRIADGVGAFLDREKAEDWETWRNHRLGQSSFEPAPLEIRGAIAAVLSPDQGDVPLLAFFASAERTIDVAAYTFTSEHLASGLAEARDRGVCVRLLLDGSPVGGVEPEEHRIVGGLLAAGVDVRWLAGASDVVKRYRYLHAKYAIVDARSAWIGSENFGDAGFPADGGPGNRGWSVAVEDSSLAVLLGTVFEADFDPRRRDIIAAFEESGDPLPPAPMVPPWSPPALSSTRTARLVIGPDTVLDPDGFLTLLASAQDHIWIEAFYLEETWRGRPNPFLEAAFDAARRGVAVRILLDGSWWSVGEDSAGNDGVAERLNGRARNESVDLEARLLEPHGSIDRLHNKGVVVDGRAVLVSSMNWALGSATENREIGILLEDATVAAFFEAAFAADWEGRPTSGAGAWRLEDPAVLGLLYAFVGVASAASLRKLRTGGEGIKPRAKVRTRGSARAALRRRSGEVRLLPAQLVAQSRARPRGGCGARRRGAQARGRVHGPERD